MFKIGRTGSVYIFCLLFFILSFTFPDKNAEEEKILAIKNARIYPVTGPVIPSGVLLVEGGKITAVGADVSIPAGARVIDAEGKYIIPGIIETHSHMGQKLLWLSQTGSDNNELSKPINGELRAIDGLNTNDRSFAIAVAGGVTTMNICPGSRSPNSGQAVVVKLRGGTADEMFYAHGGMKFAIRATEPRRNFPRSTGAVDTLLRNELREAREYLDKVKEQSLTNDITSPVARDLKYEAYGKVLSREWIVGVHSHSLEDMTIAMNIKKDFNLDLYIIHGNSLIDMMDDLIEAKIPVSFGPVLPFYHREHPDLEKIVEFVKKGGMLAFHQDHPDGPQYYLRYDASLFVRKGMSEEEALKALTINGAKLLRLDDRIGSLEPGKDADFLILNGPPLEIESRIERVFVEGKEVFNLPEALCVFRSL